jgi:hypothetical protein
VGRVWAYRAVDLAEVAAGTRNAWDALPYAVWTLHTDFYPTLPRFNAAAYDPATGRIFLSVDKSDGDGNGVPLIHVFTISQGVTTYALTVTNGGGSGNFAAGATVNILANTAAPGFAFDEWTGDVSTVADVNAASTTMIMPAAPATVTATYAALPTYALTVTNGTGDGSYIAGTVVHIVADAPGGGSVFDRWTGSAAIVNIFAASTTIAMPAAPTTVVATYTPPPLYALTVNSGTGDGNYAAGTVVTITADTAPPGQVFNSWVGATVADVAASTTTITMPAAAATVTATYSTTSSGLPIVPGAAGFGMDTRAAYGGATNPVVLRVTTIADSGAGSLRTALATTGPRVVIFDTSGAIELTTELVIADPYVTVAGQTAPAPGIMLKNYGLQIQTHDVLIQHLYIRPGADTCNTGVEAFITGNPYNIVLDHVSVSWSQSKNFAFTNGTHDMNLTLWKCICSEPLYNAPGRESCGGGGAGFAYGLLFRNEAKQVCVIQTLFTQCAERNPYCTGNAEAVVYNNLIYNWDHIATFFSDIDGVEPPGLTASVIGNYYKIGPTPEPDFNDCVASRFLASSAQIYIADVGKDTIPGTPLTTYHVIDGANAQVLTPPIAVADYTLLSSGTVYGQVLAQAGARVVDMDPVDVRIKNDVINRTGGFIQTPADVGGYPTFAVNTRVLSLPANPNTVTGSGYTNLEVWLQGYASVVEG